jgi:chromosome segregation ATPase
LETNDKEMTSEQNLDQKAILTAGNIGGIDETAVSLESGVNVLSGRNATNRTSFLQALVGVLGGEDVSIKGDAKEGEIELELGDEVYRRQLSRQNDDVSASDDVYLNEPELAELFAFLLESNEVRQAVSTKQDLRELIMRPVDTQDIKDKISRLESKKNDVDDKIERIEERKREIPDLEAELSQLENKIDETKAELKDKEVEINAADADVETKRAEKKEIENKLEELREARNGLEDVRYDIDTEQESIQSLKKDRSTLRTELEAIPETSEDALASLESQIDSLRERRHQLENELNSLQNTVQFNENMLDGERTELQDAIGDESGTTVTDQLLPDDDIVCWTCGSEVDRAQVKETLDHLRDLRKRYLSEKRELSDELDELKTEKDSIQEEQDRRQEYNSRLTDIKSEIEKRENNIEELQEKRDKFEQKVKSLEEDVESLESEQFDKILDLHKEANSLEYELGKLENNRDDIRKQIDEIEAEVEQISELESERDQINDQLSDLRMKVENLEEEAVQAFNKHMEDILSVLNYENLERVWIERVQREVRDGRQKTIKTFFELHVVRSTQSETTYEDTADHLSESEREVTGLVFTLAGYLVHDVHEVIPFMLLDSLEAIDSNRIAKLIDYFEKFPDYLVVALLEEDAQKLDSSYNYIESI